MYNGEEQEYIKEMYNYPDEYFEQGLVSWEWFNIMKTFGLASNDIHKINEV